MQIYANVAADAVWTPARTEGLKGCWQFRAGEAFKEKDGQQQESTWYTVKDYGTAEDHNPVYGKGDFLKILGRLKPAAWMNRSGKPDTTLYVHAFDISVERKVGQKSVTRLAETSGTTEAVTALAAEKAVHASVAFPLAPIAVVAELPSVNPVLAIKGILQGAIFDVPDWTLL
jgi:hypothetical protein